MFRSTLLVAATMATLLTGQSSNAQTKIQLKGQQVEVTEKAANVLICRSKWKGLQAKPSKSAAELQAIEYGSQYFQKVCKRELNGPQG